jgi:hypothetical protein
MAPSEGHLFTDFEWLHLDLARFNSERNGADLGYPHGLPGRLAESLVKLQLDQAFKYI